MSTTTDLCVQFPDGRTATLRDYAALLGVSDADASLAMAGAGVPLREGVYHFRLGDQAVILKHATRQRRRHDLAQIRGRTMTR